MSENTVVTENPVTSIVEITSRGPAGPGGNRGNYGSFYDLTDQPLVTANVEQRVRIGTTLEKLNVDLVDNKIVFRDRGTYSFTFSIQFTNTENNAVHGAKVWLKYQGVVYPDSASYLAVPGARTGVPGEAVCTVNFVATATGEDDYVELFWTADSTNVAITTIDATGAIPNAPGVILTVTQVMYGQLGPTGPTGATGEQGPAGGPTGPTGSQGIQGIAGPTGPQGIQGIEGPIGPTGPQGVQGIQGEQGVAGPTGPQGIQGVAGPTGPQGIQGIQGITGPTGPQGIQGIQGIEGPTGPQGIQGIQGIQGAVGPTGSQGIQGETGPTGPQGIQGIQGEVGPTGAQGDVGPTGPQGIQGIQGEVGPTGPQGIQGEIGPTGPTGADSTVAGPTGPTGATGPQGAGIVYKGAVATSANLPSTGNLVGDAYVATDNDHLWVWDGTQWIDNGLIAFEGPSGPTGPTGPQGVQGIQGIQGEVGPTGPQGIQGEIGPTGPQGVQGIQGVEGPIGPTGPQGDQGIQGVQGVAGPTGPTGPSGADSTVAGPTGPTGPTGPAPDTATYVTITGVQTLTNKTIEFASNTLTGVAPLESPTFTGTATFATADMLGSVRGNVTTVSASAVDCSAGNYFIKTVTGALTWTVTNVPASRAYSFLLELTNGGTGTQTWFSGIKWPGGTAPTLTTSGVDVLGFITDDGGTTWRGVQLMKDSK